MRIDLWLKLVCLFKSRSEAAEACSGGHVRINSLRAKPASEVRLGDEIEIWGTRLRRLIVEGLPESSVSRQVARTMYRDESPPVSPLGTARVASREKGAGRPTKRERRDLEKWRK